MIYDTSDGLTIQCDRYNKEVDNDDFAKHAMTKFQQFMKKNKKTIKKYGIKTVKEWIYVTYDSINSRISQKMVVNDTSIDKQDVIVVKAIADVKYLEIVADEVIEEVHVDKEKLLFPLLCTILMISMKT